MNYFERYKRRINAIGETISDSYKNSAAYFSDVNFENSPSYQVIQIENREVGVRVESRENSTDLSLLFRPYERFDNGSICLINGRYWLILEVNNEEIFPKAKIRLCNSTIKLQSEKNVEFLKDENGEYVRDRFDNLIEIEVEGEKWDEPCIFETRIFSSKGNEQFSLPDGRIHVVLKYQKNVNLKINKQFYMNKNKYKIVDFDYSKVIDEVGIMTIIADRVVDN